MHHASTLIGAAALVLVGGCAQGPFGRGGPHVGPEHTHGWAMMSQAERDQHHSRMRSVRTPEECRQAMDEHRRRMQERAGPRGMPAPPRDACEGMRR